jgi:spectinomycin phosphotransferase
MLTKPEIKDEKIVKCLRNAYGLNVSTISFLPLGADLNTAVYRVTTSSTTDYFLKLRSGEFNDASVSVPKYLSEQELKQVIPPIKTETGQLWTNLLPFKAILYPYVEGNNGIERSLSEQQWIELGTTMKRLHSTNIPQALTNNVKREAYSSLWRQTVKAFLGRIEHEVFEEPTAAKMGLFLKSQSEELVTLIQRTEDLAQVLQKQPLEYILCHADLHGWNMLIDKKGALYVVDWDTLLFAPKERDLMFIGAGIGDSGCTPLEEKAFFYQGYGQTNVNLAAIAYYRYERIIEDIGVYYEQIFLSDEGGEDRIQALGYLQSNFLPNGTIERANQSYFEYECGHQ